MPDRPHGHTVRPATYQGRDTMHTGRRGAAHRAAEVGMPHTPAQPRRAHRPGHQAVMPRTPAKGACPLSWPCCTPNLHTTGFRRFVGSRKHPAKATLHSAKPLPGVALGKEPSTKISLLGAFYRAPDKDFAKSKPGPRQNKWSSWHRLRQPLLCQAPCQRHPTKFFLIFFPNFLLLSA
jgi:hypothetical protein